MAELEKITMEEMLACVEIFNRCNAIIRAKAEESIPRPQNTQDSSPAAACDVLGGLPRVSVGLDEEIDSRVSGGELGTYQAIGYYESNTWKNDTD